MKNRIRQGVSPSGRMSAVYMMVVIAVGLAAIASIASMFYTILSAHVGQGSDTAVLYASQIRRDCRPLVPLVETLERQGPLGAVDYETMRAQAESLRLLPGGRERCNVATRPLDDGSGPVLIM